MAEFSVLSSQSGAVRTLTLNRPQVLNSFNAAMQEALLRALDDASSDTSVRCLILTGAGRAFCSGQDLADPSVAPDFAPGAAAKDLGDMIGSFYKPLIERVHALPIPILAAVNGPAAGAGANLALHCDVVIAASSAAFIQAFGKIGLIPDSGGTWLLPRLVGRALALGLVLLGDKLTAGDAERLGLIWKVVPDATLASEAQSVAHRLAMMPIRALISARRLMDEAQGLGLKEALTAEMCMQRELGFARDYAEGVTAFMGKRAPQYTDR